MKNDRLRSPIAPDYADALGRTAWTFASCEWQVVWSCERISPGVLSKIVDDELTAGKIAKKFFDLCRNMPKSKEREELSTLARRFAELVEIRNAILHGKPCTAPDGAQRLSGPRGIMELSDLENAADDFVECGGKINTLFHGFLQTYVP